MFRGRRVGRQRKDERMERMQRQECWEPEEDAGMDRMQRQEEGEAEAGFKNGKEADAGGSGRM